MNKNGWGLKAELAFVILFLICILASTIGLYSLGLIGGNNSVFREGSEAINYDYDALERSVTQAANSYYQDKYIASDDTVVITTNTLKNNGYLGALTDPRGKECKGYAIVLQTGSIVSYIKCSVYKTAGYSENYE